MFLLMIFFLSFPFQKFFFDKKNYCQLDFTYFCVTWSRHFELDHNKIQKNLMEISAIFDIYIRLFKA